MGGSQRRLIYEPFTRLEGITEKDTGETLTHLKSSLAYWGQEIRPQVRAINSVPVNFTDLDSTVVFRLSNA